jgi:hypothetical protein
MKVLSKFMMGERIEFEYDDGVETTTVTGPIRAMRIADWLTVPVPFYDVDDENTGRHARAWHVDRVRPAATAPEGMLF